MPRHPLLALTLCLCTCLAPTLHADPLPLEPFSLPWNDASSGPTSLASWQTPITVDSPRVTIDADAHYVWKGQTLRFLGVNLGADAAFPPHDRAEAHAARLARFGINAVRFHHMEAPWAPNSVLLDYATGSSRNLSADRLEKLHYFVAKLADNGVFSNINLLVSREFKATDGLGPEITQLGWKDQHILGFFHDGALALHKEHATNLLTAPNPWRSNRSLAQDPAVAVVEIMNENGLLQKWYEGILDTLPSVYKQALTDKWNAWLHTQYSDTASLLLSWGAISEPLGAEKLTNATFSNGVNSWTLEQHNGASASATTSNDFNGESCARITISTPASTGWHLQFNQPGLSLVEGQVYTLSFWARSSRSNAPLSVGLSRAHTDYVGLSPYSSPTLDTTWRYYEVSFQSGVTESNARFNITDFGTIAHTLYLANLSLKTGGSVGALGAGESLESNTLPCTPRNPFSNTPSLGQRRDWINFCLSLEHSYWNEMKAHIKNTLGYQGIVWGTIISNSPPNAQEGLDAMDSHSYWQHPAFEAGYDWDPIRWTIANVAMVNSPDSNTLTGIARQRVAGYPHNVTEYQHPYPNAYCTEGPLLSAAIGALQDWDSIWFFDYTTGTNECPNSFFDQSGHPGKMANTLVAASLFRRGDVAPARREAIIAQTPATELDSALRLGGAWSIADGSHLGVPGALALESRLALAIGASAAGLPSLPTAPSGPAYVSDKGQTQWDLSRAGRGVFTVDSPRTKVLTGFPDGRSFELSGVTLTPGASRLSWCSLSLVMTSGAGFDHPAGGTVLIVATGDQENTGQVWKDSSHTSVGANWGYAPVLIERIQAEVLLPVPASRVTAWALDVRGQRALALTPAEREGRAVLTLGNSGTTLWYEVQIAPEATPTPPFIIEEPLGTVLSEGATAKLQCTADGNPTPSLQWFFKGDPLTGAKDSTLIIENFSTAQEGAYTCTATSTAGTTSSRTALLALDTTAAQDDGRLVNLSTRAEVKTGEANMIAGFYLQGSRELLFRAIGPKLEEFSVTGVLADPHMTLNAVSGGGVLAEVDDWDPSDTAMRTLFNRTGAFDLGNSSKEACSSSTLTNGGFTITVAGANEGTGNGLVEVYDVERGANGRLVNLSTRAFCNADSTQGTIILGFALKGTQPRRVLLRGIGPTLADFGVSSVVADPTLTLYQVSGGPPRILSSNDDWGDASASETLRTWFTQTSAFPLNTGSRDAALCLWLEPGLYTVVMSAKTGSGVGLIELYEVP